MFDQERVDDLENPKNLVEKPEGFKLAVAIFLGIVFLIFLAPAFFDNTILKSQIEQKFRTIFVADVAINGEVKVAWLPVPMVTLQDVVVKDYRPKIFEKVIKSLDKNASSKTYNFYAKSIQIRFPIFKFSDSKFAEKIIFNDLVVESYKFVEKPSVRKNKFSEIAAKFNQNNANAAIAAQ